MFLVALENFRKQGDLFNVLPFVLKLGSCAKYICIAMKTLWHEKNIQVDS